MVVQVLGVVAIEEIPGDCSGVKIQLLVGAVCYLKVIYPDGMGDNVVFDS